MPNAEHITAPTQYATSADFRQIFHDEMGGLYLLSFLLTADREKAEQCFVSGIEDSIKGNPVFKEWARSWARRVIIQNAIRVIKPRRMEKTAPSISDSGGNALAAEQAEIALVLALEPFERFVYVMSVLERYSDHDCSILLGCARREVMATRIRAVQQIGSTMRFRLTQQLQVASEKPELQFAPC
jgi:DNA-directed RNA polymerase specialized sigma24 family protein